MKIKFGIWIYSMIILALISFGGCNESYKSTTKINNDGSCEKIITVRADSSYIFSSFFPIPTDKSWDPQFKILEKDTQKVFVVHKTFDDVNKINDEYKNKDKAGVEVKFEKKFRWFFTYFSYQETYKAYSPFNKIPLSSYLTKKEFARYEKGDTSKTLKKRLDEYFIENVFECFYDQLIKVVQKLNDSSLPVSLIESNKRAIHDKVLAESDGEDKIIRDLSQILKSKSFSKIEPDVKKIMKDITEKMQNADVKFDFTNDIVMPGIILNTNAETVEANKASWKFGADRFNYLDYTMNVESRTTNVWSIVVTGGIMIVIIILPVVPRFRKDKFRSKRL